MEGEACGEAQVDSSWDLVNDNTRCACDLQGLVGGLSHMPNGWGKDECVLEMNFMGWVLGMVRTRLTGSKTRMCVWSLGMFWAGNTYWGL